MKPWMTEAIGTQKVDLPSSVLQAALATGEKFSMPGSAVRSVRCFLLKRSSEASNGRQVMMSPAEPASSLALSDALYSVGAVGEKVILMPGFLASKAGMIFCCQIARSSLRQLSTFKVTSAACARPAEVKRLDASSRVFRALFFIFP